MITGKYEFIIDFSRFRAPGFPIKEGVENVELPDFSQMPDNMPPMPDIEHSVTFFEEDSVIKGIHETPRGKQKIDKVTWTDNVISWDAYAGSEGVDLFHFVISINEGSDSFMGLSSGCPPFFRGYNLLLGRKLPD